MRNALLQWSRENPRSLPWKKDKNPYQIWVSEIILQQTRVEQGLPYYHRFMERYPTVETLAATSEDELMKIWEGLGYYRRAQHMLHSARIIVEQYNGEFPSNYEDILRLKGVGDYTAAAVASFAFDLPQVVVDGNVIRVVSRLFAIQDPVDTRATSQRIYDLANQLLDRNDPSFFNQAIMDFGALQCRPANPDCISCPLNFSCTSFQKGIVNLVPLKGKKKAKKIRYFYYIVPTLGNKLYVRKRDKADIWSGLFEFYLIETNNETSWSTVLKKIDLPIISSEGWTGRYKQTLSHQIIHAEFLPVELKDDRLIVERDDYTPIKRKKIRNFAFPKVIDCFLRDKAVILNL
ncbi:MAG: A/G-specific adenine glycosylase [Saprospiraceae bacterium]|nr:A/G-specific adenine glycosylase [Saprospiraceae bacterium]